MIITTQAALQPWVTVHNRSAWPSHSITYFQAHRRLDRICHSAQPVLAAPLLHG